MLQNSLRQEAVAAGEQVAAGKELSMRGRLVSYLAWVGLVASLLLVVLSLPEACSSGRAGGSHSDAYPFADADDCRPCPARTCRRGSIAPARRSAVLDLSLVGVARRLQMLHRRMAARTDPYTWVNRISLRPGNTCTITRPPRLCHRAPGTGRCGSPAQTGATRARRAPLA